MICSEANSLNKPSRDYSARFHNVPPMLSQRGFKSGSSIAALFIVCSSMAVRNNRTENRFSGLLTQ